MRVDTPAMPARVASIALRRRRADSSCVFLPAHPARLECHTRTARQRPETCSYVAWHLPNHCRVPAQRQWRLRTRCLQRVDLPCAVQHDLDARRQVLLQQLRVATRRSHLCGGIGGSVLGCTVTPERKPRCPSSTASTIAHQVAQRALQSRVVCVLTHDVVPCAGHDLDWHWRRHKHFAAFTFSKRHCLGLDEADSALSGHCRGTPAGVAL
jgi:hypothetical protein